MLSLLTMLAGLTTCRADEKGPPFPRIANCYAIQLTPDSTAEDLDEIARWDLLIGGVWANWGDPASVRRVRDKIETVRALNPDVIVLDFSSSAPYADPKDTTFPASGWLLQPDGRRVEGWPGTQMINLTKPQVIDWLVARSLDSVRERGFDGTFIDCMGSGFDWWACNIESGAGYEIDADGDGKADERAALDETWIAAKTELARRVREALSPQVPFMANQAGEWGHSHLNGILLEDYLDYVLDSGASWDRVLEDYLHWCATPHRPGVTTIVSSSGVQPPFDPWRTLNEPARTALLERGRNLLPRMRFGLATTLMGDGYFAYDLHTRWRGQRWWYPEYDAPLGYPRGAAARQPDGTWHREFDGGTVIVNPTLFDAEVAFPERREDASGGKVDTRFIIPAQDGRLLLHTDRPAQLGSLPDPDPIFRLLGPEPVVEGRDQVLCRMDGLAALFDAQGRLLRLTDGTRSLVEGVRAFIVKDTQWRDFAYADCAHRVLPDGRLEFSGRRTDGAMALGYLLTVAPGPRSLALDYRWTVEADTAAHMFREQLDFPVALYGGGAFDGGQGEVGLPANRAPQAGLAGDLRQVRLRPPTGPSVKVELSGPAGLVDERHYGVEAFRLGSYPTQGTLPAGRTFTLTVRITVEE